jgi:hypothetical protein
MTSTRFTSCGTDPELKASVSRGAQGNYLLRFDAPAIYYFDRYLVEFEAMVRTFKLL